MSSSFASTQHMTNATRSAEVMERARDLFPGGVNSPVRAFRGVGGEPIVVARGEGSVNGLPPLTGGHHSTLIAPRVMLVP